MAGSESRIAAVSIMVEDADSVEAVNKLLHQYSSCIIGRMGIPYREKKVNVISIVMDAPNDAVSALSGKLGCLPGVSAKAMFAKQK